MKLILGLVLLASSFGAMAASVKVTSFNYIPNRGEVGHPLAEICGKVEDAATSPSFVSIVVDHTGKYPASYNTVAGADGKFCLVVISYRGTANVSIIGQQTAGTKVKAK